MEIKHKKLIIIGIISIVFIGVLIYFIVKLNKKDQKYKVTNGDIKIEGENTVITFKQDGSFTPGTGMTNIDLFMVGGGGAGGISFNYNGSGGGGGGGIIQKSIEVIPSKEYNITIGSGGVNTATKNGEVITSNNANGNNTTFGDITAPGGNQGSNGTNVVIPGSSAISGQGGQGGQGLSVNGVAMPGVVNILSNYYGGGGGGGSGGGAGLSEVSANGIGGGGHGASPQNSTKTEINGAPNTGGGGGGNGGIHTLIDGKGNVSGDGGSGIVILKFKTKQ